MQCRNGQVGLSAMSFECPPRVSVTVLGTDSEGGWAGFKVSVVRMWTVCELRHDCTAVNMPRYVISNQLPSLLGGKERPLHAV